MRGVPRIYLPGQHILERLMFDFRPLIIAVIVLGISALLVGMAIGWALA